MKIHEYQAKKIFREYGVPVPEGKVAKTPEDVIDIVSNIGFPAVIKAQVHVGGRGKAGGIKLVNNEDEAREAAEQVLGMEIKGLKVKKVLVAEGVDIEKEIYLGVINDRSSNKPVVMVSPEGGIDIEEVAAKTPEKIYRVEVDPAFGLLNHQAMYLSFKLFEDIKDVRKTAGVLRKLYRAYSESDASLAEINPFVKTTNGELWAIDAKVVLDDNALYRHEEFEEMRELTPEEQTEYEAKQKGLSYISMEGDIGCVVNGAGLAMTTMDVIKHFGGEPANFLDVGGSSSPQKVKDALSFITGDRNVKSILINIFGGITRCDDIATGLTEAVSEMDIELPLVVRLTGTNEKKGKKILSQSELDIHSVESMEEGAKRAIDLSGEDR